VNFFEVRTQNRSIYIAYSINRKCAPSTKERSFYKMASMLHISVSIYGGGFVGGQILGGPSPLPNQFMVEGLCRSLFIPGKSIYTREVYLYPGGLFIPGRSIYTPEPTICD
jgi:hypothetical protein